MEILILSKDSLKNLVEFSCYINFNFFLSNIFINRNAVKIGEFRLTVECSIQNKLESLIYTSPELIQDQTYDEKTDIW
jgi:hypothetical protein